MTQRAGAVELDHFTRHLLGKVLAELRSDGTATPEFMEVARRLHWRLSTLPEPQRLEAAGQLLAGATGTQFVAWGTWRIEP